MYLVSVYFDPAATRRLQAFIDQIAAASGNHYMTEKDVPPHLTLSAIEARSVDILIPAVHQLEGRLPHVTLGKTLSKEQMRQAFAVMQDKFSVFDAKITELGLAKVNPHEDVLRFGLLP